MITERGASLYWRLKCTNIYSSISFVYLPKSHHYGTLAPKISLLEVGTFHKCHHNQKTIAVKRHHHPLAMANYEDDEKTSSSLEEADPWRCPYSSMAAAPRAAFFQSQPLYVGFLISWLEFSSTIICFLLLSVYTQYRWFLLIIFKISKSPSSECCLPRQGHSAYQIVFSCPDRNLAT